MSQTQSVFLSHDRTAVRSVQVPRRCPVQCQEWCRNCPTESRTQRFQGASLGDFLLAPACHIEMVALWEGFLYLTSGSETEKSVAKDKVPYPNWESNPGLRVQSHQAITSPQSQSDEGETQLGVRTGNHIMNCCPMCYTLSHRTPHRLRR